jgi:hypothetical protein
MHVLTIGLCIFFVVAVVVGVIATVSGYYDGDDLDDDYYWKK